MTLARCLLDFDIFLQFLMGGVGLKQNPLFLIGYFTCTQNPFFFKTLETKSAGKFLDSGGKEKRAIFWRARRSDLVKGRASFKSQEWEDTTGRHPKM